MHAWITRKHAEAVMSGLVSTNERGGKSEERKHFMAIFIWVCPIMVSRCCFCLAQIAALSFNSNIFRLQNHRTCCSVTLLPSLFVLWTVCVREKERTFQINIVTICAWVSEPFWLYPFKGLFEGEDTLVVVGLSLWGYLESFGLK